MEHYYCDIVETIINTKTKRLKRSQSESMTKNKTWLPDLLWHSYIIGNWCLKTLKGKREEMHKLEHDRGNIANMHGFDHGSGLYHAFAYE